jgi:hypothetical protein
VQFSLGSANHQQEKRMESKTKYYVVRCDRSGVFMAQIKGRSKTGKFAVLTDSRRLFYWSGAASLSQLAMEGVSTPVQCKFPIAVPEMEVTDVIEVIPMTDSAVANIKAVPVWAR